MAPTLRSGYCPAILEMKDMLELTPSIISTISNKKRKSKAVSRKNLTASPRRCSGKRPTTAAAKPSPFRCDLVTTGAIVVSISQIAAPKSIGPPSIICNSSSPTSTRNNLYDKPKQKKKGSSTVILGLVPKSEFLKWPRANHYQKGTSYSESQIQSSYLYLKITVVP